MNVQNQTHVKMAERPSLASTTRPTRDEPVSERRADAPAPYRGFDGQYINGSWRPGRHGGVRVDTDPYSGATLAEMVMANQSDLDEAYHARSKGAGLLGSAPAGRTRGGHAAFRIDHGGAPQ